MKVFSKFIIINKSADLIKFGYVKEHETTNGTWSTPNGDVSKEFKDGEDKRILTSTSEPTS
jgi:hypothetical protein